MPDSLVRQFQSNLPPSQLALLRETGGIAASLGIPAYLVGGVVRDVLLGRSGVDFDIVLEGQAGEVGQALLQKYAGRLVQHRKFRTATWFLEPALRQSVGFDFLDLTTARRESYAHPAALPDVEPARIREDLRRRDFSINALAVRLDGPHFGEFLDDLNGLDDLEKGLVRVLHPQSFVDDPTRIFRAVRYEQRYGFQIEPPTRDFLQAANPFIAKLSAERLRHELDLVLAEPGAVRMLARLAELGSLKATAEVLPWDADLQKRLDAALGQLPAPVWGFGPTVSGLPLRQVLGYALWLLTLTPAQVEALQARLGFPSTVLKAVRAANRLESDLASLAGARPSKWVERLAGLPLVAVYAVYCASGESALYEYAARWRNVHPHTNGNTLKRLGLPPSAAYAVLLRRLRAAWLDGEVDSFEAEKRLLDALLRTVGNDSHH